jgi:hypothetical protein
MLQVNESRQLAHHIGIFKQSSLQRAEFLNTMPSSQKKRSLRGAMRVDVFGELSRTSPKRSGCLTPEASSSSLDSGSPFGCGRTGQQSNNPSLILTDAGEILF